MLVLSRKKDQVIKVGDDIEVHIVRIGPNVVRVGIVAPQSVQILRAELDATDSTANAGSGLRTSGS